MKKLHALLLTLLFAALLMVGCGSKTTTPVDMRITALKGPTAMGMVSMMDQVEQNQITDNNYAFNIGIDFAVAKSL